MSKYTTEVRFICENYANYNESQDYMKIDEIIDKSVDKIFDFEYPIYDENYKGVLERKILKNFYTREIGLETVALWKHFLDRKMNNIMPYYNELYKSALLKFNPLYDTEIETKYGEDVNRENDGKTGSDIKGTHISNTDSWNYYNDTPQGGINGLENLDYLTNATHDTGENNNENQTKSETEYEDKIKTRRDYIEKVSGKRSGISFSKMLKEYRDTIINIDLMIMDELEELFFGLW